MRNITNSKMKRLVPFLAAVLLAVCVPLLSACGKSEIGTTDITDKSVTIEAVSAAKGSALLTGPVTVEEGEALLIDSELEKGGLKIAFLPAEEYSDKEKLPDMNSEPLLEAEVSGSGQQQLTIGTGSYMVRVSVTKKATGRVDVMAGTTDK